MCDRPDETRLLCSFATQLDEAAAEGYAVLIELITSHSFESALTGALLSVASGSGATQEKQQIAAFIEDRRLDATSIKGFDEFVTVYNTLVDWLSSQVSDESPTGRRATTRRGSEKRGELGAVVGVSRQPSRAGDRPEGMMVIRAMSKDDIDIHATAVEVQNVQEETDEEVLREQVAAAWGFSWESRSCADVRMLSREQHCDLDEGRTAVPCPIAILHLPRAPA